MASVSRSYQGSSRKPVDRCADRVFSFVHLDCDIYESYKQCLEFFYLRLTPGAIVLFDEYNDPEWLGCTVAVDEFFSRWPERRSRSEVITTESGASGRCRALAL
jgi:hypothetical protein